MTAETPRQPRNFTGSFFARWIARTIPDSAAFSSRGTAAEIALPRLYPNGDRSPFLVPLIADAAVLVLVVFIGALVARQILSDGAFLDHFLALYQTEEPLVWIAVIIVQLSLIVAFLFQNMRRRRAEARNRESEEGLALAAASANIGLWKLDTSSDEIRATDHCRQILGIKPGTRCSLQYFLDRVHAEYRPVLRKAIEEAVTSGRKFDVEVKIALSDSGERWITAGGQAHYDQNHRAVGLTGVFVDITDRKAAEADAAQQRDQIARLTRLGLLGQLSGAVAHELNQPLAAILSNAQAAQRMLSRPSFDLLEVKNTIRDIIDDDSRAGEVIRHLRALLTKGVTTLQKVDPVSVVNRALDLARADLMVRQVSIVRQLAPKLPLVKGDSIQLQQVILNLVVNASESMMQNDSAARVLTVSSECHDGAVEIAISDNGPGIAQEAMQRLFEPFYSTKSQGLGLGLSISRSIMTAHGGTIWAENNSERGASFRIKLPTLGQVGHD